MVSHLYPVDEESVIYYIHHHDRRQSLEVFLQTLPGKVASVFEASGPPVFPPAAAGSSSSCSLKEEEVLELSSEGNQHTIAFFKSRLIPSSWTLSELVVDTFAWPPST